MVSIRQLISNTVSIDLILWPAGAGSDPPPSEEGEVEPVLAPGDVAGEDEVRNTIISLLR